MRYEDIVLNVREVYENADARAIFEHIAVQVNLVGEVTGAFYIEVAQRQICVEPYDYRDRDILVTVDSSVIMDLVNGKTTYQDAAANGMFSYTGNEYKFNLFSKIKLRKPDGKKELTQEETETR